MKELFEEIVWEVILFDGCDVIMTSPITQNYSEGNGDEEEDDEDEATPQSINFGRSGNYHTMDADY